MQYQIQAKALVKYVPLRFKELLLADMSWIRLWVGINTFLTGMDLANYPQLKESVGNFEFINSPVGLEIWASSFIVAGIVGMIAPFFEISKLWTRLIENVGGVILWALYVAARPPLSVPVGITFLIFEIWLMARSLGDEKK
jgi:hypothetical protein